MQHPQRRGGALLLALFFLIGIASILFLSHLGATPLGAAFRQLDSVVNADDIDEARVISYASPVPLKDVSGCLCHVSRAPRSPRTNATREGDERGPALIVSLAALASLASESALPLALASASALSGFLDGGVNHVLLVPGPGAAWTARSVAVVADVIAAARDLHGDALYVAFSAVSPAAVQCMGVGETRAGVAAALAGGASSVLVASHVSLFNRTALFFEPGLARFLPQLQAVQGAASPSPPLRRHFLACGGDSAPCSLHSDAPRLCSTWVRPLVQYGLCHPSESYAAGRHTTAAANTPFDAAVFPGPTRLLEEVTPVVLLHGAVLPLAGLVEAPKGSSVVALPSDTLPGESRELARVPPAPQDRAYNYNVLADASVAWVLGSAAPGGGLQVVLEAVVGWLGGNLTVLPPGRLCNVSRAWEGDLQSSSADANGLLKASAATAAALLALPPLPPGNVSLATLIPAVMAAARAAEGIADITSNDITELERWLGVYAALLRAARRPVSCVASNASEPVAPVSSDANFLALRPADRESLTHCFSDHHNVRDILCEYDFCSLVWHREIPHLVRPFPCSSGHQL